jgi:hypothetical protein
MNEPIIASSVKSYINNPIKMIEIYISDIINEWVAFLTYEQGEEMREIKFINDPKEDDLKKKIIEVGKKLNIIIKHEQVEINLKDDQYARFSS